MKMKLASFIRKYQGRPEFLGIDIANPNQPGAVDDTLLHLTARIGDLEGIEVLIASGAKVNATGDPQSSAIPEEDTGSSFDK